MQITPWPALYMPAVPTKFPTLSIQSTYGVRNFGATSVKSYVCGITPYDSTHLGHAATYITFDLIHRYIRASGGTVAFVENVTDIDEPLLERAQRDSQDWRALALNQVELFQSDMVALHVLPPQHFVPATSAMSLVDDAISAMDENGYVYRVENDLYFLSNHFLAIFQYRLTKRYQSLLNVVEIPHELVRNIPWIQFCGGLIKMVNQAGKVLMAMADLVGISNVASSASDTCWARITSRKRALNHLLTFKAGEQI